MQAATHRTTTLSTHRNRWLRRAGTAGFVFFLVKGLAWTAAAAWVLQS